MQSTSHPFSVSMPPSAERTDLTSTLDDAASIPGLSVSNAGDADMMASSADLFSFLASGTGAANPNKHEPGTAPSDRNPFLDQHGTTLEVDPAELEILGNASLKPSRPSSAGPLRHRRGHQDRQLSINSFASNTSSNNDAQGEAADSVDSSGNKTTASSEQRTVKLGDHAFTIPLSSPVIPPQLQANMRMTSTGRPSHARKVPDDHVKRPRNAFILFRSYACTNKLLPPSLGITDHRQVSRIVGQLWKGLKPEEKAIWEKLAFEEKERHELMNPNYRYRPTYRKEVPSKRRRKKAVAEEEMEEEDRKCEVVARVLLEGREVDTDELEKEVEVQKIKDQQEGRTRTSRTRSRSRSNSKLNESMAASLHADAQAYFLGAGGRPSSAPPQGFESSPGDDHLSNGSAQPVNLFNRPKRSRTIATSGSADFAMGNYSMLHQPGHGTAPAHTESFPNTMPPTLRNASNLQHLFANEPATAHSEPTHTPSIFGQYSSMSQSPFLSSYSGFKGSNADPSLLSPSFSRKFSLGRWEVPHHPSSQGAYGGMPTAGGAFATPTAGDASAVATAAFQQPVTNGTPVNSAGSSLGSQEHPNYSTVAQPTPEQPFDPAAVPPGYNFVPTYVYLSKEDAQNPQIVEHYLSQGFGVSYDT